MSKSKNFLIGLLALVSTNLFAMDPISWTLNQNLPGTVLTAQTNTVVYTFTNQIPLTLVNPLVITKNASSGEFTFDDQCTGKRLFPGESCTVGVTLLADSPGIKSVSLAIDGYDCNEVPIPELFTFANINPFVTYSVGGNVSGLSAGSRVDLQLNGGEVLVRTANGAFVFQTRLLNNDTYTVTILNQPLNQTCTVANGQGTIRINNINNVSVTCTTNTATLGGTLSGLAQSQSVQLQDGLGHFLTLNRNGTFTFSAPIDQGSSYNVTVTAQPATQTCRVANGQGTMGRTNVTNVTVTCSTNSNTLGGTVSGLAASENVTLQDGLGQILRVNANGTFTFPTPIDQGQTYNVGIFSQPNSQTCVVTNRQGTMGNTPVTNVLVTCTTNRYSLGGSLSGLDTGNSKTVTLRDQTSGQVLTLNSNGNFTFPTTIEQGQTYNVSVLTSPNNQRCDVVSGGTGTMGGANVTNIRVTCTTFTYTLGGTITGLNPARTITLTETVSGQQLIRNSNGSFTFTTPIGQEQNYNVAILTPPTDQNCRVENGQGTMGTANVTNVRVICLTKNTLGGTLIGLAPARTITLIDNVSGQQLTRNNNGTFTFPTPIEQEQNYDVVISIPPTDQNCSVENGQGTMGTTNVTNIRVICLTRNTLGGTLSGLISGRAVTLRDAVSGQLLMLFTNGTFVFPAPIEQGQPYNVGILFQPTNQQCRVENGVGIMGSTNVTTIRVICVNTYSLGGTLVGLDPPQTVTLQEQISGQLLDLDSNGNFIFPDRIPQGQSYSVIVFTQPDNITTCNVMSGTGVMGGGNVGNITVTCALNTYTLGGTLTGLNPGLTVTINDGGTQNLTLNSNGSFEFPTQLQEGTPYNVTVVPPQPFNQSCTVTSGSGTISGGPVNNVEVTCVTFNTILSTSVSELALSVDGLIEYGVPGTPSSGLERVIKITNETTTPAYDVNISYPAWPTGTIASGNCPSTLAGGASCFVNINPGTQASSNGSAPCTNGTAPQPSTVTVSASNVTNSVSTNVFILGYGCIYQGGYIFAFDDTSSFQTSVRGKVVSTGTNVSLFWSANADGTYDGGVPIYGISETSIATEPGANPQPRQIPSQIPCNGSVDGFCNTNNIVLYYQTLSVPKNNYSAGYCENLTNTFTDWYLPAICELSYNSNALTTCGTAGTPTTQNIRGYLRDTLSLNLGGSWSSTESSANPTQEAWSVLFFPDGTSSVGRNTKNTGPGTLCVRTFND